MKYRVKVTEKHSDYVWVEAESQSEAEEKAPEFAECEFECTYSSEATGETEAETAWAKMRLRHSLKLN